jgi:hypothetical protein
MINKEGKEVFPGGDYDASVVLEPHQRPPAFNPDSLRAHSVDASDTADTTDNHNHMLYPPQQESYATQEQQYQPPPYYDANLHVEESVVWDENLIPERSFHSSQNHVDIPVTPRNENGDYLVSPHEISPPKKYWMTTKIAAKNTWNKCKELEETHQVFSKTKRGYKTAWKTTRQATVSASQKIKEFDEKHQVLQKSKNGILQGSTYITKKCRGVGRSTVM